VVGSISKQNKPYLNASLPLIKGEDQGEGIRNLPERPKSSPCPLPCKGRDGQRRIQTHNFFAYIKFALWGVCVCPTPQQLQLCFRRVRVAFGLQLPHAVCNVNDP